MNVPLKRKRSKDHDIAPTREGTLQRTEHEEQNAQVSASDKPEHRANQKCSFCRQKKIKCRPLTRKWPEDGKCQACHKSDLPCGPNMRHDEQQQNATDISGRSEISVPSMEPIPASLASHQMSEAKPTSHLGPTWDEMRAPFTDLYIGENMTLHQAARAMEETHGFHATARQWERRINNWGLRKYTKRDDRQQSVKAPATEAGNSESPSLDSRNVRRFETRKHRIPRFSTGTDDIGPLRGTPSLASRRSRSPILVYADDDRRDMETEIQSTTSPQSQPQLALPVMPIRRSITPRADALVPAVNSRYGNVTVSNRRIRFRSEDSASFATARAFTLQPLLGTPTLRNAANDLGQPWFPKSPVDPRQEIRLVNLLPGDKDDPLQLESQVYDLLGAPEYEAVSFLWGRETPVDEVIINGTHSVIPPSLYSALQILRLRDAPRRLWIDYICINAQDSDKRSQQLALVPGIFSRSSCAIIWLGPAKSESSADVVNFIKNITNTSGLETLANGSGLKQLPAFLELTKNRYWRRAWVLQEIAAAKQARLYWGKAEIGWAKFVEALSLVTSSHEHLKQLLRHDHSLNLPYDVSFQHENLGASRFVDIWSQTVRKSDNGAITEYLLPLETLLSMSTFLEVSHPPDKIYALLSLAADVHPEKRLGCGTATETENQYDFFGQTDHSDSATLDWRSEKLARWVFEKLQTRIRCREFRVDYSKSFFAVAMEFLNRAIEKSKSLDIICYPWAPHESDESLPSWISTRTGPAFKLNAREVYQRVKADPLVGMPGLVRIYNASGKSQARCMFGRRGNEQKLYVDGFVLDTIGDKYLPAQLGNIPFEWIDAVGWHNADDDPPDSFWKTLVADRGTGQKEPPFRYRTALRYLYAKVTKGFDIRTDTFLTDSHDIPRHVTAFVRCVQSVIWQRCLIHTENLNLLGLVNYEARSGDFICILYGCSVPVVLRKQRDRTTGRHYYRLIGECYVHLMMDGNALRVRDRMQARAPRSESITQTFELR